MLLPSMNIIIIVVGKSFVFIVVAMRDTARSKHVQMWYLGTLYARIVLQNVTCVFLNLSECLPLK
jgi:hypothetical protein